jgi:hypothetical protein
MAYTVTIEPPAGLERARETDTLELRRLKRVTAYGPRCPDCAGPLVFGEGCHLCPVCGYSACGGRA